MSLSTPQPSLSSELNRTARLHAAGSVRGSLVYTPIDSKVFDLSRFKNIRVNWTTFSSWDREIPEVVALYSVSAKNGQCVGVIAVDTEKPTHGRFGIAGVSLRLSNRAVKQVVSDIRGIFTRKINKILGTRGCYIQLPTPVSFNRREIKELRSEELQSLGFRPDNGYLTSGPGNIKDNNRVTLTVYVRDRILTILRFLESVNKNSFYDGHEVILMCHPEYERASIAEFAEHRGKNTPMRDWIAENQSLFPRIRVRVMSGYQIQQRGKKPWLGVWEGFNRAISDIMSTEYVVTNMSCGVWFMPNWDLNMLKWRGYADVLIPRYVELRGADPKILPKWWHTDRFCDVIKLENHMQTEENITTLIGSQFIAPGYAAVEDCAERRYGYVMGMTMTREAFLQTGGFHDTAYPDTSDFFFDDVCRDLSYSKLLSLDSVIMRTRYAINTFRPSRQVTGGKDGLWHYPDKCGLLVGSLKKELADRIPDSTRVLTDHNSCLGVDGSIRLGVYKHKEKLSRQ